MLTSSNLLYQTQAIKKLEEIAIEKYHISIDTLMQRAGRAAFRILQQEWPQAQRVLVICGKGNNAGDGYVVAKCAYDAGLQVKVLNLVPISELKGAAYNAAQACVDCGVIIAPYPYQVTDQTICHNFDVIVDALLGTGLQGSLQQNYHDAICAINHAVGNLHLPVPVLALDLPSGLMADSGAVLDVAVRAQVTVTFIGLKTGLVTANGNEYCGKIICDDLDLAEEIMMQEKPNAEILDLEKLRCKLPRRGRNTHKGDFGHVLVIGGDYGMGGAVRLAAEAAARVGAGLVSIATRKEHISAINAARPEMMCHGVTTAQDMKPLLERATCIVLGPGLGKSPWSKMLFDAVLHYQYQLDYQNKVGVQLPLVIDADGLNLLAEVAKLALPENFHRCNWVLTPHPGEAGRLLGADAATVQNDRYQAINNLQQKYGGVVVLKGAGTLVKGSVKGEGHIIDNIGVNNAGNIGVCPYGNPGMASAGMGDVLSGVIGGLLAQKLNAFDAACLAVCVHAKAGDLATAPENGGERGMLALDLIPYIRKLLNN